MTLSVKTEDAYEDMLGQWSDLESGLAVVLNHPHSAQEFEARIRQYARWLKDLSGHDSDVALYLLFQLATHSPVGYSAAHALVCAVLCHFVAQDFELSEPEHDSLVHAALTMNVAMTALQNELATQVLKPDPQQQQQINHHAELSAASLVNLGVRDTLWLEIVRGHHPGPAFSKSTLLSATGKRLAMALSTVDRYAAMISPRQTREGRSATDSALNIIKSSSSYDSPVGQALVRVVGPYPPGTLVELDDDRIAVVTRKSTQTNAPDVAVVLDSLGNVIRPPLLHQPSRGRPYIREALPASVIRERINHHVILQLGTQTN
jgi:hypothetical protein